MIGARGRERTCQEASTLSKEVFIPCGLPAVCIVDSGDQHPYWMCAQCADHNVRNRGATLWLLAVKDRKNLDVVIAKLLRSA